MSDPSRSNTSSSLELRDCLIKARAGDQAARDRLFAACRSYVSLIARATLERRLQAKVDASDLVQQTMMDAHRDFDRFAGQSEQEWLAWLRRILAHNAGDAYRHYGATKRQAQREISLEGTGHASETSQASTAGIQPVAPDDTPSQILQHQELELAVAEAMEQLPEDYREVIFLRNMQRLPFDEVAARMERSRPAVQMLWARALQRLRDILGSSLHDSITSSAPELS